MIEEYIKKELSAMEESLEDTEKIKRVLEEMAEHLQSELISSEINLQYSGSTLILTLLIKNFLYFFNVGDSRAVLASKIKGRLCESFSTKDHNPDIPEERERIESMNGKVSPLIDENGESYGPFRVWNSKITEPGLAMSRSFGDTRGHQLGVISSPGKKIMLISL